MLKDDEFTARDISRILGITEKEVYEHLPHVERSAGPGVNLIIDPARCLKCGFVFIKRKRFTSPGRCPVCRSESISQPVYGMRGLKTREWEDPEETE
jgi:transcriptional regulator